MICSNVFFRGLNTRGIVLLASLDRDEYTVQQPKQKHVLLRIDVQATHLTTE